MTALEVNKPSSFPKGALEVFPEPSVNSQQRKCEFCDVLATKALLWDNDQFFAFLETKKGIMAEHIILCSKQHIEFANHFHESLFPLIQEMETLLLELLNDLSLTHKYGVGFQENPNHSRDHLHVYGFRLPLADDGLSCHNDAKDLISIDEVFVSRSNAAEKTPEKFAPAEEYTLRFESKPLTPVQPAGNCEDIIEISHTGFVEKDTDGMLRKIVKKQNNLPPKNAFNNPPKQVPTVEKTQRNVIVIDDEEDEEINNNNKFFGNGWSASEQKGQSPVKPVIVPQKTEEKKEQEQKNNQVKPEDFDQLLNYISSNTQQRVARRGKDGKKLIQ